MRRSRLLPFALAALLLCAGCASTLPGTDSERAYPAGVADSGVDASTVTENHRAALNDTSFTLSLAMEQSLGNRSADVSSTYRVGADRENVSVRMDTPFARRWVYLTGDTQYGRIEAGNRTQYDVRERTGDVDRSILNSSAGASLVNETLALGNYSVAGTETRDGTTYTTLNATGLADETERPDLVAVAANVSSFDSTVVIDGDGVVRSVSYTMVLTRDEQSVTTALSMNVTDVGSTTATAPDWIDEAEASA